jgi:predicted metal-binding protein/2-polyprenyl-3-methyl-5-hydroxy-6-metoxy-1,4-benzoquinol methylase
MKKKSYSHMKYDHQASGSQYLEDLATGYWFSEVLFIAVEMELFTFIEKKGMTDEEVSEKYGIPAEGLQRFLHALSAMGLLTISDNFCFNTKISDDYLVIGKNNYQGDSILWRKYLSAGWKNLADCLRSGGRTDYGQDDSTERVERIRKYLRAMDAIARTKTKEILGYFEGFDLHGSILDVGAGSGAVASGFLQRYPAAKAILFDIAEVLEYTAEFVKENALEERAECYAGNILESWKLGKKFELIILSNILHAYSEKELEHILQSASTVLEEDGLLLIHDFFLEHRPRKAALTDLNMFINTFNGKVFSGEEVRRRLEVIGLHCTDLIPLETDTGLIFGSKISSRLECISVEPETRLGARLKAMGFTEVYPLSTEDIRVSEWTGLRCRFGCNSYGKPHCPPNSPSSEKTRNLINEFRHALLLEGEPPTKKFQMQVLSAEREAFISGFHKAFAYWAGPCSICESCSPDGVCTNTKNSRPSMEGAGIDVFETARKAGASVKTLKNKDEFVRYFALLLLQ